MAASVSDLGHGVHGVCVYLSQTSEGHREYAPFLSYLSNRAALKHTNSSKKMLVPSTGSVLCYLPRSVISLNEITLKEKTESISP